VVPNIGAEIVRRASARHAVSAANALARSCGWRRLPRFVQSESRYRIDRVIQDSDASDLGHRHLEELEMFPAQARGEAGQPCGIPSRTGEAGHESRPHRVTGHREHDRHRRGKRLRRLRRASPPNHQDIKVQAEEFGGEWGKLLDHPVGIAILDDDILALGVAQVVQPLPKHGEEGLRRRTLCEHADPGHLRG
jgi:hypothetical protein